MPHLIGLTANSDWIAATLVVPGAAQQQGSKPTAVVPVLQKTPEAAHGCSGGAPHHHQGWGTVFRAVPLQSGSEQAGLDQAEQGRDGGDIGVEAAPVGSTTVNATCLLNLPLPFCHFNGHFFIFRSI